MRQDQTSTTGSAPQPRSCYSITVICQQSGGQTIQSKIGHALIKERMRKENVIYDSEMSPHDHFRDFAYCDRGMIP